MSDDTFAAGIEAAAKWHEEQADLTISAGKLDAGSNMPIRRYFLEEAQKHRLDALKIRNIKQEQLG